ncbi:MAG: hypothetical protein AB8B78_00955 [Polaribacter sp.]
MKKIIPILILILSLTNCFCQKKSTFQIEEILIERKFEKVKTKSNFGKKKVFFEDENYIISGTCRGEWGGSVWFENKKTGKIYSCQSACPKSVNKIENNYIITNSLAHMSGYSEIIRVNNPENLDIFKKPKPRKDKNGNSMYFGEDFESKSRKGVKVLWTKDEILTLLSFHYKTTLYHVMTFDNSTYLTKIENGELKTVDKISEKRIWTNNIEKRISESHTILYLGRENQKSQYLEIKNNKLKLVRNK